MSRYEAPATIAEAVEDFRDANRRIRAIHKNGGLHGRNKNGSRAALASWYDSSIRAMNFILAAGERNIAGLLTDEAGVIDNIAKSVTERPELQQRLVMIRRDVRRQVQHLATTAVAA